MNEFKRGLRATLAEVVLILTMVEVGIAGSMVPEYRELAIFLSIPFVAYSIFYILIINK